MLVSATNVQQKLSLSQHPKKINLTSRSKESLSIATQSFLVNGNWANSAFSPSGVGKWVVPMQLGAKNEWPRLLPMRLSVTACGMECMLAADSVVKKREMSARSQCWGLRQSLLAMEEHLHLRIHISYDRAFHIFNKHQKYMTKISISTMHQFSENHPMCSACV